MSAVTEVFEFLIAITIILAVTAGVMNYFSYTAAQQSIVYFKNIASENIVFYLSNNTLYLINKGQSLNGIILKITIYYTNGTIGNQVINIPSINSGLTTYTLKGKSILSIDFYMYSSSGGYIGEENLKQTSFFVIKNMYSSSYVFINGNLAIPAIQNFSTYYYPVTTKINNLLLYSQFFYYNTTLYNTLNFTLPLQITNYNFVPILINGTKETSIPGAYLYINNKYKISANSLTSNVIPFSYSGNQVLVNYCYLGICSNPSYTDFNGIINLTTSTINIPIYQNSNVTFILYSKQKTDSVPGEIFLYNNSISYGLNISVGGSSYYIRNGNYLVKSVTFNNYVNITNISIFGSNTYYIK
ncbi:MAG: hypothetical protein QW478_04890 [Candidatus Micrarchaeaceae archaeon]